MKIFDASNGTETKDVAFGEPVEVSGINIVNKSVKLDLYSKQNLFTKSQ